MFSDIDTIYKYKYAMKAGIIYASRKRIEKKRIATPGRKPI